MTIFSGSQLRIFELKKIGLTNIEIANKLHLAESTIKTQTSKMRQKGIEVPVNRKVYKNHKAAFDETYEYWKKYNFEGRIKTNEIKEIERKLGI